MGGAVFLLLLMYQFSIKNTLSAVSKFKELSHKANLLENAPAKALEYEMLVKQLQQSVGTQSKEGLNAKQALLVLLGDYCNKNKTVIRDFPPSEIATHGNVVVETNKFVVEGSFKSLIKLVYLLEQKNVIGKVMSVRYQFKKDKRTRRKALTATIYVKNIKNAS